MVRGDICNLLPIPHVPMACVITGAPIALLEISPADEDTPGTPAGSAGPPGLMTLTQVGDGPDV